MNFILIINFYVKQKENGNETSLTPPCIARFTCEIQWNYWFNHRKDVDFFIGKLALERQLNNLYVYICSLFMIIYKKQFKNFARTI